MYSVMLRDVNDRLKDKNLKDYERTDIERLKEILIKGGK